MRFENTITQKTLSYNCDRRNNRAFSARQQRVYQHGETSKKMPISASNRNTLPVGTVPTMTILLPCYYRHSQSEQQQTRRQHLSEHQPALCEHGNQRFGESLGSVEGWYGCEKNEHSRRGINIFSNSQFTLAICGHHPSFRILPTVHPYSHCRSRKIPSGYLHFKSDILS